MAYENIEKLSSLLGDNEIKALMKAVQGSEKKLSEVSIELALALALYSSKEDVPLKATSAAFGELTLAGEVRPVSFAERRLRNLADMGFSEVISADSKRGLSISTKKVGNIKAALIAAFSARR